MRDLKDILEKNGCSDVRTHIQSGNVIVSSRVSSAESLAKQITAAISKSHGFEPTVLALTPGELQKAVSHNPFPQAGENPASLHLFFLGGAPDRRDMKPLEAIKASTEAFALKGNIFYLYTPDGFGRSKLAARVEKLLGVEATARNWRTVTKLLEMAGESV
jgi:uncharacterized protein (DUF1697 family)